VTFPEWVDLGARGRRVRIEGRGVTGVRAPDGGCERADSWATDAHKTLNVPYDCGLAIVRDPSAVRAAMSLHGDYLIQDERGVPFRKVPELSRRGRAFTVWAALRSLGRSGVAVRRVTRREISGELDGLFGEPASTLAPREVPD
jgi:Pyridoxal-dependent decarboxylase conserved domain